MKIENLKKKDLILYTILSIATVPASIIFLLCANLAIHFGSDISNNGIIITVLGTSGYIGFILYFFGLHRKYRLLKIILTLSGFIGYIYFLLVAADNVVSGLFDGNAIIIAIGLFPFVVAILFLSLTIYDYLPDSKAHRK